MLGLRSPAAQQEGPGAPYAGWTAAMRTAVDALAAGIVLRVVIYDAEAPVEEEEEERPAAEDAAAAAVHVLRAASSAAGCWLMQAPGWLPTAAPTAETAAAGCPA